MIILQSKVKQGKTTELIKRFMQDENPATLITDEMTLYGVADIVKRLKSEGVSFNQEAIKNTIHTKPDYGCYRVAKGITDRNLYIDSRISQNTFEDVKKKYRLLEKENDIKITITKQLPMSNVLEGVYVVEI